jgi:hypothetical protein
LEADVSRTLPDLYHRHVAAAFDRQMRLSDFLEANGGGEGWGYDVPSASLTFGEAIRFEAQLLGSFAEGNATWLWAWANRHLNLPPANATLAEAVRGLGKVHGLPLFTADESVRCGELLPEELLDSAAHVFGVVVAGELGHDAYYTLPYEGGRGVALLQDARVRSPEPHPLVRIASVFPQAISSYTVLDHRAAFVAYVESYGFQAGGAGQEVSVRSAEAPVMAARFDERNRLVELKGRISPGE